jgi:hypothetical protein
MKYLIVILLVCGYSNAQNSFMVWDNTKPLKWEDYKSTERPDIYANALTTHKIEIFPTNVQVDQLNRILNYKSLTVKAIFFPNDSWSNSTTDVLLVHENIHFAISELFARKIRKEFSALILKKERSYDAYFDVYKKYWNASRIYQKEFEEVTNNGVNEEENIIWKQKIDNELKLYKDFE